MPTYQYLNADGTIIERRLPVADRDSLPGRLTVPRRVSLPGAKMDPALPEAAVPKALRETEIAIGAERLCKEIGYPAEEVRRIWSE